MCFQTVFNLALFVAVNLGLGDSKVPRWRKKAKIHLCKGWRGQGVGAEVGGGVGGGGWGKGRVGGGLLICLFILLMMSPVKAGRPHACLSPQTRHATLFPRQSQHYVNLAPPPSTITHTHTWKKKMMWDSTRTGKNTHKQTKKKNRTWSCYRCNFSKPARLLDLMVAKLSSRLVVCDAGRSSGRRRRRAREREKKTRDVVGRCECAVSTEQRDQLSLCVPRGIGAGRGGRRGSGVGVFEGISLSPPQPLQLAGKRTTGLEENHCCTSEMINGWFIFQKCSWD